MPSPFIPPAQPGSNFAPSLDAPKVEWALWAARQGFRVIPVRAGAKQPPTIPNALNSATCDEAEIRLLWSRPGHEDDNPAFYLAEHVALDFDQRDEQGNPTNCVASVKRLGVNRADLDAALRVRTPKGLHAYWRRPDGAELLSRNQIEPNIDLRALGGQGYLMGPGSVVELVGADGTRSRVRYEVEHLPDEIGELPPHLAEAIRSRQKNVRARCKPGAIAVGAEPDSDEAISWGRQLAQGWEPAIEGSGGHGVLLGLAMRLGDMGLQPDTCVELLTEPGGWNDSCSPPWALEELDHQVRTLFASREKPIGCDQPGAEFSGIEIEAPFASAEGRMDRPSEMRWARSGDSFDPDEDRWLVPGLVPAEGTGFLSGASQSGKTFLLYHLAACLGTQSPFFGETPEGRFSTIILQSESFSSGRKRLRALDVSRGPEAAPLPIHVADAGGIGMEREQIAMVIAIEERRRLIGKLKQPPLGLIAIDTLSASRLLGEENSNDSSAEAVRFMSALASRFGCFVLALHHPPKAGSGLRGGGALSGNVDVVLEIRRDGKAPVREVECVKQRDGEQRPWGCFTLPPITIGARANGKPVTSCTVSTSIDPIPAQEAPAKGAETAALAILKTLQAVGTPVSFDHWLDVCTNGTEVSSSESPRNRRDACRRTAATLVRKGLVVRDGETDSAIVRLASGFVSPISAPQWDPA